MKDVKPFCGEYNIIGKGMPTGFPLISIK